MGVSETRSEHLGLAFFLILLSPIAAITGGVAGAIVGGGREDRPIWQNSVIGIVGWAVASTVVAAITGSSPEEFTLGFGLLALLASIAFIIVDEWWYRRSHAGVHERANVESPASTGVARVRIRIELFLIAMILVLAIVLLFTLSVRT